MINDVSAVLQTSEFLGIPPEQCDPKVNILTFDKWIEAGRIVERGNKSCARVPVFGNRKNTDGENKRYMGSAILFHITQTKELTEEEKAEQLEKLQAKRNKRKKSKPNRKPVKTQSIKAPSHRSYADKFRVLAEKMQGAIDEKLADRLSNTPKRQQQAGYARQEGEHLKRTQAVLLALADMHDKGTVPECLRDTNSKKAIHDLTSTRKDGSRGGHYTCSVCTGEPWEDTEQTRAIFDMLKPKSKEDLEEDDLKRRVDSLQFTNIPGYFPTPDAVIDVMIEKADLYSGCSVLEPSAGHGAIVDALVLHNVTVSACEVNHTLYNILKDKGVAMVGDDFMEHSGSYDRVIMNPPFERTQDIDHVMHAFGMLGEMGRLVSVMSPFANRSGAKSEAFLKLVEENGSWEKLPSKSFKQSGTNVETVLVILDK